MRVVIVGAGIAGWSLALALRAKGHASPVLEKSPHLRDEGYMLDFFGPGYGPAETFGLIKDLERIHYSNSAPRVSRSNGPRAFLPTLPVSAFAPVPQPQFQLHARRIGAALAQLWGDTGTTAGSFVPRLRSPGRTSASPEILRRWLTSPRVVLLRVQRHAFTPS